ncbi:MAG TPA: dihydrodipicolinate synthase family protein [Bryobacteraceae bacterium]
MHSTDRREFLRWLGAGALGAAFSGISGAESGKPMRGVFPIGQTPFTADDRLDLDSLAGEVKFCNRGGVSGFAWPQIASGWSTLSEKERLDGAETILAAGKGGRTSLVIGVQTQGSDVEGAIRYAKHAARNGADAVISLPPAKAAGPAVVEYYKTIGAATELPLIVQSTGDMSVDLIVEMLRQIPTMKCVKDEAGNPLLRITEIRERTNDKLAVFSGNGVRTMIDEMRLGFAGHCPFTGLADLYQSTFDLWHSGKRREAFDMFGRIQAFSSIPGVASYILVARGVFKETTRTRPTPGIDGGRVPPPLEEAQKQVIRQALADYLKPYLRA